MDRNESTANLIIAINDYRHDKVRDSELITNICAYFDSVKNEEITQSDLKFLNYISNIIGIPHYFDLLEKFNKKSTEIEDLNLCSLSSLMYESTLYTNDETKIHKYQKQILDKFEPKALNRFFLSASTSFGKTFLVFEAIQKMKYKNVVLIFPTIALLSENLERLLSHKHYHFFNENYSIHTLSEVATLGEQNIFIYTPERFLSFIEKNENKIEFDFAFVDEVYKIDNEYLIDETARENERDVAYRIAVHYAVKGNTDVLLAGPYIEFSKPGDSNYNSSFNNFLTDNKFTLIDYNEYEIVNKSYNDIKTAKKIVIDDDLKFEFNSSNKKKRLISIVRGIISINENCIVYCYSKSSTEAYAKELIEAQVYNTNTAFYQDFLNHITTKFGAEWVVVKGIENGIGIHHGLVPKYIQKEIIRLFNEGHLRVLLSTTTITEGVNTSAKNLIVLSDKKGDKPLKKFDAKNISGRAGRFLYHYSGRVIVLQNKFMETIKGEADGIKHKNFDLASPKDEIDLFYTKDEYLIPSDTLRIKNILAEQKSRNIPEELFDQYKVVSRVDKMKVFDAIKGLTASDKTLIRQLISVINFRMDIDYDGFQVVLRIIEPIVKNENLRFLITYQVGGPTRSYSLLTNLIHYYLVEGFIGSVNYRVRQQGKTIDEAIKQTCEFVYNTLKYQVVKYLGVFNVMYKFEQSQSRNIPIEDVSGLDKLLTKMEYNALTENGRIVSDYGVPSSIVDFYESPENSAAIKGRFDQYELEIFNRVDKLINKV